MFVGCETMKLSTGNDMPAVGLGTWLVSPFLKFLTFSFNLFFCVYYFLFNAHG